MNYELRSHSFFVTNYVSYRVTTRSALKNATFLKAWCELMRKPSRQVRISTIFQWNQYEMKSMHVNISNFFLIYTTCLQRLFYMFLKLFIYKKNWPYFWKNICSDNENVHVSQVLMHSISQPPDPIQCWARNYRFSQGERRFQSFHRVGNIGWGPGVGRF